MGEADFRVAGRNFCDTRLGGPGLGTIWSKGTLLTSVCPTFLMGACQSRRRSLVRVLSPRHRSTVPLR